jgi:hypothetical protein
VSLEHDARHQSGQMPWRLIGFSKNPKFIMLLMYDAVQLDHSWPSEDSDGLVN